ACLSSSSRGNSPNKNQRPCPRTARERRRLPPGKMKNMGGNANLRRVCMSTKFEGRARQAAGAHSSRRRRRSSRSGDWGLALREAPLKRSAKTRHQATRNVGRTNATVREVPRAARRKPLRNSGAAAELLQRTSARLLRLPGEPCASVLKVKSRGRSRLGKSLPE